MRVFYEIIFFKKYIKEQANYRSFFKNIKDNVSDLNA